MKVLIALASSSAQMSGVQRHAINLARCLLMRDEVAEVHLAFAPWQQEFVGDAAPSEDPRLGLHAVPIGNNPLSRNLWFHAHLPKLARRLGADIVHLAYPVPVNRNALACPAVVTLHDLYPFDIPENFGFPKVVFNRAILRSCLRSVDAIACVSQSTLSRLERLEPQLARRKATLIYNSVEPQPPAVVQNGTPTPVPFLLCVAQHRRNKNILLALKVFERLLQTGSLAATTRMIIVGIPGPETPAIHHLLKASGLSNKVDLLNGISDQDLEWCYRNCEVLLAPSIEEGFGLPVAEALMAGCRVVCSDIPAFREFGGHCRFVPLGPEQESAFADAVRDELLTPSPAPFDLPQLSAPVIAARCMGLYRSLLTAGKSAQQAPGSSFQGAEERQQP